MAHEIVKSEDEWEAELSPERYHVLREKGTEPAWTGTLLDVHDPGLFRCSGCGAELFRADDKFDSGSGWPSFTQAVRDGVIDEHEDRSFEGSTELVKRGFLLARDVLRPYVR